MSYCSRQHTITTHRRNRAYLPNHNVRVCPSSRSSLDDETPLQVLGRSGASGLMEDDDWLEWEPCKASATWGELVRQCRDAHRRLGPWTWLQWLMLGGVCATSTANAAYCDAWKLSLEAAMQALRDRQVLLSYRPLTNTSISGFA